VTCRRHVTPGDVAGDFERRRNAAHRQSAYARRRRLGQIIVAVQVSQADLTRAGLARGLLSTAAATRQELERVGAVILDEAIKD
jgi:ribosomal protein S9